MVKQFIFKGTGILPVPLKIICLTNHFNHFNCFNHFNHFNHFARGPLQKCLFTLGSVFWFFRILEFEKNNFSFFFLIWGVHLVEQFGCTWNRKMGKRSWRLSRESRHRPSPLSREASWPAILVHISKQIAANSKCWTEGVMGASRSALRKLFGFSQSGCGVSIFRCCCKIMIY